MKKNENAPAQSLNEQETTVQNVTEQSKDLKAMCEMSFTDFDCERARQEANWEKYKAYREQCKADPHYDEKQKESLRNANADAERHARRRRKEAYKKAEQTQRLQSLIEKNEDARQMLLTYVPSLEPFEFDTLEGLDANNFTFVPLTEHNIEAFLDTSYEYGGMIRYNEITGCSEYDGERIDDAFYSKLREDASKFFGKRVTNYVDKRFRNITLEFAHDPVVNIFAARVAQECFDEENVYLNRIFGPLS